MSLEYNKELIPFAKELRKNMTPQERKLWYEFLREYPVRFQRQKTIENYIADFYCHRAKLVIEIDGGQHYEDDKAVKDKQRTEELEKLGLAVLRFSNRDVNLNFRGVCEQIISVVEERLPQSLRDSSLMEGALLPQSLRDSSLMEGALLPQSLRDSSLMEGADSLPL